MLKFLNLRPLNVVNRPTSTIYWSFYEYLANLFLILKPREQGK